jgi:dolichol-phosphate mannosyltransferase
VFEVDSAVLDYEPDLLMEAYRKCLLGYDIVSASPITAQPRSSKLFYSVFNLFSNTSYPLKTERFRVVSRRAIHRVESLSLTNMYRKALYAASGLQMDCIIYKNAGPPPSGKRDRLLSRWRRSMAIDSLVLFTNFAYRVTLLLSVIMAMFMLISGIYTVAIYVQSRPVEGWAPMMGLISAGFLVLFLVLSVIIKYLDLLLNLIFMKQNYLIANIEKLK